MATRTESTDLAVSAQRGARVTALSLVNALEAAHDRCVAAEAGALHDVRVAVRRLRSWIRAYEPVLDDTVSKKSRRALRKLADATSVAREAEVLLEILDGLPEPPRTRSGHADLRRRLERETSRTRKELDDNLAASIPRVVERLKKELSHFRLDVDMDRERRVESMAEFSGDILQRHGDKLAKALESLDEAGDGDDADPDADALHRIRIEAKRLRYIAEQLPVRGAPALVERLTALQDALGEHRDARLLAERALAEIGRSAQSDARARARALLAGADGHPPEGHPARSRVRPGLLQIARAAEARADEMLRKFETEWPRASRAEQLRAEVREVAADLATNG